MSFSTDNIIFSGSDYFLLLLILIIILLYKIKGNFLLLIILICLLKRVKIDDFVDRISQLLNSFY